MPPPSALAISTSSVRRLLKEEASYHKELADQEANIRQLEEKIRNGQASEDGNDEYVLKQQKLAAEQTKAVFEPLKKRIGDAVEKLEDSIAVAEKNGAEGDELEQAKSLMAQSKADQNGSH